MPKEHVHWRVLQGIYSAYCTGNGWNWRSLETKFQNVELIWIQPGRRIGTKDKSRNWFDKRCRANLAFAAFFISSIDASSIEKWLRNGSHKYGNLQKSKCNRSTASECFANLLRTQPAGDANFTGYTCTCTSWQTVSIVTRIVSSESHSSRFVAVWGTRLERRSWHDTIWAHVEAFASAELFSYSLVLSLILSLSHSY